jgi:hypothetical protein
MGEVAGPAAAAAEGVRPRVVVAAVGGARADAAMRLLPADAAADDDVGTVPGTDMAASTSLQAAWQVQHNAVLRPSRQAVCG